MTRRATLCTIALACLALAGCATGKEAAPLRSSVAQADLAAWAIHATAARSGKNAVDEMVGLRLVAACKGASKKLDAETCDLLALQQKYAIPVRQIETVAEAWVMHAIKNPDAPASAFDFQQLLGMALKGAAASQTGGLSGLLLK